MSELNSSEKSVGLFGQPIEQDLLYCTKCQKNKPFDAFKKRSKRNRKVRRAWCRECERVINRIDALKPRRKQARRARELANEYGLDEAGYDALLHKQGGLCAICRGPEVARSRSGNIRRLGVDHDHATGAVRGILCGRCNNGIAQFLDDINLLQAAIAYLESPPAGTMAGTMRQ